jgi:DNA-binding NtrC family response regulator
MAMEHEVSGELATVPSGAERQYLGGVFAITVIGGPDAGASLTLNQASPARMLVGKSVVCTLRLTDPEVSRRHLSLRAHDDGVVLMDLGSMNGTFVNGVRVREAVLRGGESIRLGATAIAVDAGAPSYVSLVQESSFGRMFGESRVMRLLYPMLHKIAARDFSVLIEGESGVGKRLCGEEIHARSSRAGDRFISVACRALPPGELEERLFGPDGLAQEAAGGTIYLDEVASLSDALQRRLLDVVRRPPGEPGARFLFGTRQDLDREVTKRRFREDLFAALATTRVEIPPLREREGDIAKLAATFWSALSAETPDEPATELPPDFMARSEDYSWPGNVRELSRAVYTRFCLGEFGRWHSEGLRNVGEDAFDAVIGRELRLPEAREVVVQEFERRYISYMLERYGNTKDAAKASGVAKRYFQLLRARLHH